MIDKYSGLRMARCLILCLLLCGLTACVQIKTAHYQESLPAPADAHPAPIGFSGLKFDVPTGQTIGVFSTESGPGCLWPYHEAERGLLRNIVDNGDIRETFGEVLKAQGYDVTGSAAFYFADDFEDDLLRSEYKIGAVIREVEMKTCYDDNRHLAGIIRKGPGFRGEFYIVVDWHIYDALRRSVVYRTQTKGYAQHRQSNSEGLTLLLNDAFAMAVHNLGADPAFHDLLFRGVKPAANDPPRRALEERPRVFDPDEKVHIPAQPLYQDEFANHADTVRHIAVMVQSGRGHGSGFFITPQGHIITNAHVVGDALRVRVVLAGKKDALVAEVLRKDKARDVALLKLEKKPEIFNIVTVPLQMTPPPVGTPVYSIGAPLTSRMQDTVRSGIISAHRHNFSFMGTRQDLLQADVPAQGGNSGGPLLDRYGNLIGLSHGGIMIGKTEQALNMFIPIASALKALDIEY